MSAKDLSLEPRRTTWGAMVQTAAYARVPLDFLAGTTINEKYNVFASEPINRETDFADLGYFGIGRGSTYMKVVSVGTESTNYLHEPVDAILFNQQPFILRTLDNDIPADKRAKYALRAIVEINSVLYVAYYLKRLDKSLSTIVASSVIPATSEAPEDVNPLVSDPRYLNPTPTKPEAGNERTDGKYVRVSCLVQSKMDAWDIDEMLNAKQIITGTTQLEITEIGIFSAISKTVTDDSTGTSITYTEALRAQLNVVSPHRIMVNHFAGRELIINHDFGVDDPTNFQFNF